MNQRRDDDIPGNEIEVGTPQVNRGNTMFGLWVLGYLVPGLIGLAVLSWQNGAKKANEQERLQREFNQHFGEGAKRRIEAGEATDVDLVLMGVDREKYAKYKQQLDARAAEKADKGNEETEAQ